jgi:penicillin amidase
LTVPGLTQRVTIRRDRWGIPHIDAAHDADAWFALGFCHGQDRTFQLEVLLRLARGALAELVGRAALPIDRFTRRLGLYHSAQQQLPVLDPEVRAMVDAYAHGINAAHQSGLPRRPHEFVLLRTQPSAWTAVDPLGTFKVLSLTLASNWDLELARLKILTEDGPEALAALDPSYPEWQPVTTPVGANAGPVIDRLAADLASVSEFIGPGGASNNWALNSIRTATGRPLLANDPHLQPALPPHWYLARLRTPKWSAAGASIVGGPGIAAGHNGFAAWGMTAAFTDTSDLFIEEVGADGKSVRQGDRFVPCEVRNEHIQVKGEAPVFEEVLVTPRGPIISPALHDCRTALSLRAVWLDPLPVRGSLVVHRIRSFEDFRQAFALWPGLPLNMLYADRDDRIAWQLVGQLPRRKKGFGTLPQAGWDPEGGWEADLIPLDQMPSLVNPASGFLATANQKPTRDSAQPFLGVDWLDGYRQARILGLLGTDREWGVSSTLAAQMDQLSLPWGEMAAVVLAIPHDDPDVKRGLELLAGWDGRVAADSSAAGVFELLVAELVERVARAKAPRSWRWALGGGVTAMQPTTPFSSRRTGHLVRLLREQPAGWLSRTWPEEIADALAAVIGRLANERGDDPANWAWGRLRPLTLKHPLGYKKLFAPVFNLGPIPWGGDLTTLAQTSARPHDVRGDPGNIASLRMVIDVGEWSNSRFVLPGGQSGNPLSPHYGDQFEQWQRGEGVPIAWTDEEVRAATVQALELRPEHATE